MASESSSPNSGSPPDGSALGDQNGQFLQAMKRQAVGQLAGGVAHDLNNILLLISTYSEQLLSRIPESDPCHQAVAAIRDAGGRATDLTRQLQALSQRQVLRTVVVDLNELIRRADERIRREVPCNIVLTIKLSDSPATVKVDPVQFERVLMSLIQNAQQAMPDGGWLTIETRHDQRQASDDALPERVVCLAVTDTGGGMTDEMMAKIFEPYSTKKGFGGSLALAAVHGVVSQSGGHIGVTSSVGSCTTFEIRIPAVFDQVVSEVSVAGLLGDSGGKTVMLVEDEERLREILSSTLASHGYTVLEAKHGPAAIATACRYSGSIDVLLTDIEMPEMTGREVATALREQFPHLPTIFMSGSASEATLKMVMSSSDYFLQKPFISAQLLATIKTVLGSAGVR